MLLQISAIIVVCSLFFLFFLYRFLAKNVHIVANSVPHYFGYFHWINIIAMIALTNSMPTSEIKKTCKSQSVVTRDTCNSMSISGLWRAISV
ncbi:hypothetical protein AL497_03485 [Klebsiella aerogenes]|nr:hypothetical protein AL497_03485 [Klebsiella aerogenes]EUL98853.1 hypothetical protein P817_02833 [Klebsiella aerogenes UCI 15]